MLCCSLIAVFFAQPLLLFERTAARLGAIGLHWPLFGRLIAPSGGVTPLAVTAAMAGELTLAAGAILALRFGIHTPLPPGLSHLCRIRL